MSTALAAITGTLGTILGAYLGVQTGAAGKESAKAARREAEERAVAFAAVADRKDAMGVLRMIREKGQEGTRVNLKEHDLIERTASEPQGPTTPDKPEST